MSEKFRIVRGAGNPALAYAEVVVTFGFDTGTITSRADDLDFAARHRDSDYTEISEEPKCFADFDPQRSPCRLA
jgi:hypothetical protein